MSQVNKEFLENIKQLQTLMESVKTELGTIALIESRKTKLIASYEEAEASMKDVRAKIYDKYGDGTIDLATGEFTPSTGAEVIE